MGCQRRMHGPQGRQPSSACLDHQVAVHAHLERILEELADNLTEHGLPWARVERRIDAMRRAFPDATVRGFEELIETLTNDPKDRHVLAAGIRANCEVLVTFNLKDFPKATLAPFNIEPLHPDNFIVDLWDLDQAAVLKAAQRQRASLKKPPHNARLYLDKLLQQKLPETVKLLGRFEFLI